MLDVGDGQLVYWETCGRPDGRPALVLHGGPGSGCTPGSGGSSIPTATAWSSFDQRGCGRSSPHASEPGRGPVHQHDLAPGRRHRAAARAPRRGPVARAGRVVGERPRARVRRAASRIGSPSWCCGALARPPRGLRPALPRRARTVLPAAVGGVDRCASGLRSRRRPRGGRAPAPLRSRSRGPAACRARVVHVGVGHAGLASHPGPRRTVRGPRVRPRVRAPRHALRPARPVARRRPAAARRRRPRGHPRRDRERPVRPSVPARRRVGAASRLAAPPTW